MRLNVEILERRENPADPMGYDPLQGPPPPTCPPPPPPPPAEGGGGTTPPPVLW